MKLAIAGATGRMGLTLIEQALAQPTITHIHASVRFGQLDAAKKQLAALAIDPSRISLHDSIEPLGDCDAIIDFTQPELSLALAAMAAECGTPLICGTTGLSAEQFALLKNHASRTAILWSANMSIGVNLLMKLVEESAATLDASFDIEILEMHHRNKVDAPSGTALALGRAAADGRKIAFDDVKTLTRDGKRQSGAIGFAALRGGQVVGDHTVIFANDHERIELSHKAQSREIYAQGAIKAAQWLKGKPSGFYSMKDVING